MCLDSVDPKPVRKFGIGYKAVRKTWNGQYECYDYILNAGTITYPPNQWLTDPNDGLANVPNRPYFALSRPSYRTGFHIMLDKPKSGIFTHTSIIKVKFRKVVATNTIEPDSIYGRQVVAREIMNLGEI